MLFFNMVNNLTKMTITRLVRTFKKGKKLEGIKPLRGRPREVSDKD